MRAIRETLWVQTEIGGVARYANDRYQSKVADDDPVPGNPWLICTLWLAEHAVARATSIAELQSALDLLRWVRAKARPSLVLPEQVHPHTGAALSVSPFSWSHAQVVSVVRGYLDRLHFLRRNGAENASSAQAKNVAGNSVDKPSSFS
jgi:GH15 family glucan-1,4-alpha-glucosidase